jgi:biotin transport system substrate-specific component
MKSLPQMVLAALFTGLMVAGALIVIPFPGIPLVVANALPWLAGLVLGPLWGAVSVALYVLLGAFGLPVFAGGAAGLGGPTTGFLFGYVVSAAVAGFLRAPGGRGVVRATVAVVVAWAVEYAVGVAWMALLFNKIFVQYFVPQLAIYLVGDLVKTVAVVAVAGVLARLPGVDALVKKAK